MAHRHEPVADAIRAAGAPQLIAVPAFHGAGGFTGFAAEHEIAGGNVVYEIHPSYEFTLTDDARDAMFGSLASRLPVYAGEWGVDLRDDTPACRALPRDPQRLTEILFETFLYFDRRQISWTASVFRQGSLIVDDVDYLPTVLDRPWTCGQPAGPQPGMGEVLLYQTTGDPGGFGSLWAGVIANAAGGPASPVAPGQLLSLYVEQLGPDPAAAARFDASGSLPLALEGARVLFDGAAAPIIAAGAYQITVQAPYGLAPGSRTTVQVFANNVPSNRVALDVVASAVEVFHDAASGYTITLNDDGSRNGPSNPARGGSIVVLFASGGGQTAPAGVTGRAAPLPHPRIAAEVALTVDGRDAAVLFAGEVPGFAGLMQVNARLPAGDATAKAVPVVIRAGAWNSRAPVLLWTR